MESFRYTSLDMEKASFRLLRLIKGQGPVIECEIFQSLVEKHRSVPYEALSYAWGSNERSETIITNGRPSGVTNNLHLALSYLRLPHCDRILWVDALCIDQENLKERTHQVGQMARIYGNADSVIFWLGQANYATNVAMESLKALESASASVTWRSWKKNDERWRFLWSGVQTRLSKRYTNLVTMQCEGMRDLLGRSWYERVWIIQEVAQARRGVVCCGAKSVSARIFALSPYLFPVKPSPQAQAILSILPGQPHHDSWWTRKHDLYTLLHKFRHSKAHDPRDMVYALLGIASDPNLERALRPDYEKTEQNIIREVIAYLCHLDIECLPETTDGYWNGMVDSDNMEGFLRTIDSLYAAAIDQHTRCDLGVDTKTFVEECGQHIRITGDMIHMSYAPGTRNMVELLIEAHGDQEMLHDAARTWKDLDLIELLLTKHSDKVRVTELVLVEAAENPKAGEVISLLLEKGDDVHVTYEILRAMAESNYASDVFVALFGARKSEMYFTPELLEILRENESQQARKIEEYIRCLADLPMRSRRQALPKITEVDLGLGGFD